jgi:hypothetical protein
MNQHFRRIMRIVCLFATCVLSLPVVLAQDAATRGAAAQTAPATEETKELPRQFREIVLGMSLDDLKAALEEDQLFNFRGDRDVSFLPAREESLVETSGSSFIKRAFFQLRDGALFIMAFTLNTSMMDHYSVFTDLVTKYGPPTYLDPKEAVWETEEIRVSIERPLTIKYIDKKVFDDIINESALVESRRVQQRQEFLNEF